MKTAVETLSPTRVRLTVDLPFEELKPELDQAYRDIAKQVAIPGFRKGKVPPPVIDRQVGRSVVFQQAVNAKLPKAFMEALEQSEIDPIGQPDFSMDQVDDGGDIKFSAEVDVRPEFELPDYKGLSVSVPDIEITDEQVEEELAGLRERFASLRVVERAATDGDVVTIDLSASQDGEPVEGAQLSGHSYKIGDGGLVDGIDEALQGLEAGQQAVFASTLVGGDLAGQEVEITATVQNVKEQQLPDLDDAFAQDSSQFDTLAELREDLRDTRMRRARLEQAIQARDAVLDKLLELVEMPMPEVSLNSEIQGRKDALRTEVRGMGLSWEDYLRINEQSEEEHDADVAERTTKALKAQFILDKIANAEVVTVGQEEIGQRLVAQAQRMGMDPQTYIDQVVQGGDLAGVIAETRRNKALSQLVEGAQVTDASGNAVELSRLQADGTVAPETTDLEGGESSDDAASTGDETVATAGDETVAEAPATEIADPEVAAGEESPAEEPGAAEPGAAEAGTDETGDKS